MAVGIWFSFYDTRGNALTVLITFIVKNGLISYSLLLSMEFTLAHFCISYSVYRRRFIESNRSPTYKRRRIMRYWLRPVLKLRIDPNQLSSGSDTVRSLSLPPGNITSEVSGTPK